MRITQPFGYAQDLEFIESKILLSPFGITNKPRAVRLSNGRWGFSDSILVVGEGKEDAECASFAGHTVDFDAAPVDLNDVLDNGEPQAGSADLPAPGLVHPVKALKETGEVLFFNADALVTHLDENALIGVFGADPDLTVRMAVFDGIVQEVHHGLFKKGGIDLCLEVLVAGQGNAHVLVVCLCLTGLSVPSDRNYKHWTGLDL